MEASTRAGCYRLWSRSLDGETVELADLTVARGAFAAQIRVSGRLGSSTSAFCSLLYLDAMIVHM